MNRPQSDKLKQSNYAMVVELVLLALVLWVAHCFHIGALGLYEDDYSHTSPALGWGLSQLLNASIREFVSWDLGRPLGFVLGPALNLPRFQARWPRGRLRRRLLGAGHELVSFLLPSEENRSPQRCLHRSSYVFGVSCRHHPSIPYACIRLAHVTYMPAACYSQLPLGSEDPGLRIERRLSADL